MATKREAVKARRVPPVITVKASPEERAIVAAQKRGSPAVNPENLIGQAIKAKVPIETLEKLLAMRRELKAEWAREQYFAALASFQAACPVIAKTKVVHQKNSEAVRYRYAPLDAIVEQIKAPLETHGFSYRVETEQGAGHVTAILIASHRDGHSETTRLTMPVDADAYMTAPQKVGSALTYAKRYAFCDAFGILTGDEDDDGNGAENGDRKKPAATYAPEPPRKSERNITPQTATKPAATPAEPVQPAARKLPDGLVGIKQVGADAYWLLRDGYDAQLLSKAYCETQGVRLRNNKGNQQFLDAIKIEIIAKIEEAKKPKETSA